MRDANSETRRDKRARKGAVDVAGDDDSVGTLPLKDVFKLYHHIRDRRDARARASQEEVRLRKTEFAKKDAAHIVVVMLAGVD